MEIFYRADNVLSSGEIVIVGRIYKDDVLPDSEDARLNGALAAHGETIFCQQKHAHSKSCAQALLDQHDQDAKGKDIPGTSAREKHEAWFAAWDSTPEDPVPVDMPEKTIAVVENGRQLARVVDDRDLT